MGSINDEKNPIQNPCNSSDEFCSVNSLLGTSTSSSPASSAHGSGLSGSETDMSADIVEGFSRIKKLVTELLDADETKSKIKLEENEQFVKKLLKKFNDSTSKLFENGGSEESIGSFTCETDVNTTSYLSDEEAEEMFAEMSSFVKDNASQKSKLAINSSSASSSPSSAPPPCSMRIPSSPVIISGDKSRHDLSYGSTASSSPRDSPVPSLMSDSVISPPVGVRSGKSRYEQIRDDIIAERNQKLQAMGFFDEFAATRSEMIPKKSVVKGKVKAKKAVESCRLRRSERLFLSSSENEEKLKSATQVGKNNVSAIIDGILTSVCKKRKSLEPGNQPFLCNQCGKRFGIKSNLNKHRRKVHGQGCTNDVSCKAVEKRCENRDSLRKHTKNYCVASGSPSEKPFSCGKCDFRTRHRGSLWRHEQKAHKEAKSCNRDDKSLHDYEGLHSGVMSYFDDSDIGSIDIFTDDSGDDDTEL